MPFSVTITGMPVMVAARLTVYSTHCGQNAYPISVTSPVTGMIPSGPSSIFV